MDNFNPVLVAVKGILDSIDHLWRTKVANGLTVTFKPGECGVAMLAQERITGQREVMSPVRHDCVSVDRGRTSGGRWVWA